MSDAFAPTDSQKAAMAAMKALSPGEHWSQVYNQLRISYPDDFKDNDHDIYVVANHYASVPAPLGEPPVIMALSPNSAPANADITVDITGTGFTPGATVNVGIAVGHVPISVTPTELSLIIPAKNIEFPGTLPVKVVNGDGQESNSLDFVAS